MNDRIEARLRHLEDLASIHQLFIDYGLALDAGDFTTYANLFARDGELLLGPMGRATGPRDALSMARLANRFTSSAAHRCRSTEIAPPHR
jgi:hypothetical protein